MDKNEHLQILIDMLKEIDTKKNNPETVREILDHIAKELEKHID